MLKNVAIPLMLAASEAEAQPSNNQILDAIRADREKNVPKLQADAAACTVASSQTEDGISNAAGDVTAKEGLLATAKSAVTTLQAADTGAWTIANAAREAAVAAAVASEADAGIAGKLDLVDEKAGLERVAAAAYVAADKLYQDGKTAQTAAATRVIAAGMTLTTLTDAKTNSAAAAQAVRDQVAKEALWREWLYCELGKSTSFITVGGSTANWWTFSQDSTTAALNAEPASCTVPAVANAAGAEVRAAVVYWTSKTGLTTEADDGSARWNATLDLTTATTAEENSAERSAVDSGMGNTQARQQVGVVAWATENVRMRSYISAQRGREAALYGAVMTSGAAAKVAAADWQSNATATNLTTANTDYNWGTDCTDGSQENCKSTAKRLAAAVVARDAGSALAMPCARHPTNFPPAWACANSSVNAFKTANTATGVTANAAYAWWLKASAMTEALDAWYTAYAAKPNSITSTGATAHADVEETETQTTAATPLSAPCASSATTDGWVNASTGTTIALCKLACITYTVSELVVLMNYNDATAAARTNGKTAKFTAAGHYCGAYSFAKTVEDAAAGTGCTYQKDSETVTAGTAQTDSRCFVMKVAGASPSYSSKAWYDKQAAVKTAWDAVIATTSVLQTNMAAGMGVQADLEKAWLNAHYDQQYWAAVDASMSPTTNTNELYLSYAAPQILLGGAANATGATAYNNAANATADSVAAGLILTTAQATLTTLQADTATAQATVDELGRRIVRATAEIAELGTLSDATTPGVLDAANVLRLAEYNAFASDGVNASFDGKPKGEKVLADEAKAAADLAVRAQVSTVGALDYVAPGALTAARTAADAAWTAAKLASGTAESDLSTALSGAVLATLRGQVDTDTQAWTTQQNALDNLVAAVVSAESALKVSVAAKDALVLACQIKAYDAYRTTLEAAMVQRNDDLKTIKGLIVTELTKPAPGTIGARCEKALSNGTKRPDRVAEVTCGEGNCCGAARVWMAAGPGTANSMWRTIETCQVATDTTYSYQPARSPLATSMPTKVSATFTCIEGAKKLAAAASAAAAALYMLA